MLTSSFPFKGDQNSLKMATAIELAFLEEVDNNHENSSDWWKDFQKNNLNKKLLHVNIRYIKKGYSNQLQAGLRKLTIIINI